MLLLLWAALELKSHPLKPISYFCGVAGPLNLTPSSLFLISAASFGPQISPRITSLHLCTYFTSQYLFLPKGLFSVFLLLSPYFHTPAFQKPYTSFSIPIFAISAALLRPHTSFSNALTYLATLKGLFLVAVARV